MKDEIYTKLEEAKFLPFILKKEKDQGGKQVIVWAKTKSEAYVKMLKIIRDLKENELEQISYLDAQKIHQEQLAIFKDIKEKFNFARGAYYKNMLRMWKEADPKAYINKEEIYEKLDKLENSIKESEFFNFFDKKIKGWKFKKDDKSKEVNEIEEEKEE